MKSLNITFFLFLSFKLFSQNPEVTYPYQSIFIGIDSYIGYNKVGDAFGRQYRGSTNPYMRNLIAPSLGVSHRFNQKTTVFAKAGYGFALSDDFDSLVGNDVLTCTRKIRVLKFDAEANYVLFTIKDFGFAVTGELGYSFVKEKTDCFEDYNFSQIGFGGGVIFYYRMDYAFSLKYYNLAGNQLLGAGFNFPFWSNINN